MRIRGIGKILYLSYACANEWSSAWDEFGERKLLSDDFDNINSMLELSVRRLTP